MTDDRWQIKGSDEETFKQFRKLKAEYSRQQDERVTDERALQLLLDGVDIEPTVDYERIRQIVRDEAGD